MFPTATIINIKRKGQFLFCITVKPDKKKNSAHMFALAVIAHKVYLAISEAYISENIVFLVFMLNSTNLQDCQLNKKGDHYIIEHKATKSKGIAVYEKTIFL